ncbi:MAG: RDD family protein [Actinomycetia bacterium]|nr:RDD family protein [Actinomycetes bacterium]
MTDQPPPPGNYPPPPPPGGYPPPPPPGGYPPPPPPGGGFPPPPQQGGFPPQQGGFAQQMGMPGPGLPKESYTPWTTRVLAWVLDFIPVLIVQGIAWAILVGTQETVCITDTSEYSLGEFCASGASTFGQVSIIFATIVILAYVVWNFGYRQGTTGSSIGKSIMKFKVVSEKTWQPIGFGLSIVRQLAHIIDGAICYIGYLFPLWDAKRQTIADKIMNTVCLPL